MTIKTVGLLALTVIAPSAYPSAVPLGTAGNFAVIAGTTVTNTNPTLIQGDLGVYPGTAITGFPPGVVISPGTEYATGGVTMQAHSDLQTAYNFAAGEACSPTNNLSGTDLGGRTLMPGVYCFDAAAQLTGTLTLDGQGNPNSSFVFQIGSALTTATNSAVAFVNNAQGGEVFWQFGSSATLGTGTQFAGNMLAYTSITLETGANIGCGRALAINGAVALDTNSISIDSPGCVTLDTGSVPEPGSAMLFSSGLFGLVLAWLYLCRSHFVRLPQRLVNPNYVIHPPAPNK